MSDAAIMSLVSGAVTVTTLVVGFLTLWARLRYGVQEVGEKVDDNTRITRAGTTAAATNAAAATAAATQARRTTEAIAQNIERKLNGGIDAAVAEAVAPIRQVIEEHARADEETTKAVESRLAALDEYVHRRNHERANEQQALVNKLDLLLELARRQAEKGGEK